MFSTCLLFLVFSALVLEQDEPVLKNGGFEAAVAARPGADGLVNGWKLVPPPQVPANWTPNPA